MAVTAAQLIAKVSVEGANAAKAELGAIGAAADSASGMLKGLAIGGAVMAGAALVGIGVKSVQMAGDFQQSMTQLVTGAGESQKNIQMVSDGILAMAPAVGTTTQQLSAGMYMIESSGQHGSQALETLRDAAMGAKVGAASLADVANGVTTAMTDYAKAHLTSAQATNTLIATVAAGKTHMGDLANAMSSILPTSAAVGVGFTDVSAAMATMTAEGTPAADAATYLRQLLMALESPAKKGATALKEIGLSSAQVADEMKKSLPDTLQMITDHLKKKFPEGSAAYVSALKDIAGGSKQMQGILELTGQHLDALKGNFTSIAGAVKQGGNAITGWSDVQKDFNFKLDQARSAVEVLMIKIGQGIIPVIGQLLDRVTPLISAFSSWVGSGHAISDMLTFFHAHAQIIIPVLAGLGAIILSILMPAVASLAAGVIAATWPFLVIGGAVAGLVAIFMHFYQTNAPFKAFIDQIGHGIQQLWTTITANFMPAMSQVGTVIRTNVLPILQQIGGFLVSTFKPVWDQLVATFHSELLPAWNSLVKAIQPLLPQLKEFAIVIGAMVGGAVLVAIGIIGGLIHAFSSLLSGVISIFGGVVSVISGAIKVVSGVIALFVDLATGNFSKLGSDLGTIMDGIGTMFHGVWEIIKGVFQAAIGAVVGFVKGFIDTIVGVFTHLADVLVGHSIVPDMINAIVSWFAQLPGRVIAFVQQLLSGVISLLTTLSSAAIVLAGNLVNGFLSWLGQLPGRAGAAISSMISTTLSLLNGLVGQVFQLGANIVTGIANGIMSAIGSVTNAIGNVVSVIADHLPHSPAKRGPLSLLNEFGPALVNTFANDIKSSSPAARAAAEHMASEVVVALSNVQTEIKVARARHEHALLKTLEAERRGDEQELKDLKGVVRADGFKWDAKNAADPVNFTAHHTGTTHHAGGASLASTQAANYLKEIADGIAKIVQLMSNPATSRAALSSFSGGQNRYQFPTIGAGNISVQVNPPSIYLDGRTLAIGLMPYIANAIRYSSGTTGI